MFKNKISTLKLAITGFFWLLCGDSEVKISMTDNRLYLKLETNLADIDYLVHVDEISYRVKYKRFYVPDRVRLLYRVTLTRLQCGKSVDTWVDYYPDLYGGYFRDKQYGLNQAASIHVSRYFDPHS